MRAKNEIEGKGSGSDMTKIIHLANTDVEFEYAHPSKLSLGRSWSLHPLCLQLQYFPLLYAKADDLVAVTEYPDDAYLSGLKQTGWWPEGLPRMVLLDSSESLEGMRCLSWGLSRQVQAWAAEEEFSMRFPQIGITSASSTARPLVFVFPFLEMPHCWQTNGSWFNGWRRRKGRK